MVAIYYIVHFLAFSGVLIGIPGASTAVQMLGFGVYVITIFSAIFLFYTQSTLIKGRKKEFGLYSVLGMNKNNLGMIIFYETIMTWIAAIFGGLILGIGMSKVAELGFTRMIAAPVNYDFRISTDSVLHTIGTFTVIFLLIWLNTIRQIKFSSAIELVRSEKAGEKPRHPGGRQPLHRSGQSFGRDELPGHPLRQPEPREAGRAALSEAGSGPEQGDRRLAGGKGRNHPHLQGTGKTVRDPESTEAPEVGQRKPGAYDPRGSLLAVRKVSGRLPS